MSTAIAVIVLSYNGLSDTLACLESLVRGSTSGDGPAIIVVDNASSDGAAAEIARRHPDITVIALPENRGWAGGNNAGIAHALGQGAGMIGLLNNDTIIPAGGIAALAEAAAGLGPCLLHPCIDYADPAEGAQLDPGIGIGIGAGPAARLPGEAGVFELGFAYGACLMIHAEIFRRIGLFDERFFLQLEETDFWMRAKAAGYRSLCTTQVRIRHGESRSFGGRTTPLKSYYIVRNTLLLTEKHARSPGAVLRALRSLYWTIARLAEAGSGPPGFGWIVSRDPTMAAVRRGLRDYAGRRFGRIGDASRRAIAP